MDLSISRSQAICWRRYCVLQMWLVYIFQRFFSSCKMNTMTYFDWNHNRSNFSTIHKEFYWVFGRVINLKTIHILCVVVFFSFFFCMMDKNSFICSFDSFNRAYRCLWFTFHSASVPMTLDTNCRVSCFFLFSFLFSGIEQFSQTPKNLWSQRKRHLNPMSKPTNGSKKPQKKQQHEQRQGERTNKQKIIQEIKKEEHAYWVTSNRSTIFAPRAMYATTMPTADTTPATELFPRKWKLHN